MNAELRPITLDELRQMSQGMSDAGVIVEYARLADPLFAAVYKDILLGFVAFIPYSTLSDTAYIWVHTTTAVEAHRLAVARLARRMIPVYHTRYTTIAGHCVNRPSSIAWLRSLGAVLGPLDNGLLLFTIRANHG
jgi:hypothetical protein